jgi:hypothetical protein
MLDAKIVPALRVAIKKAPLCVVRHSFRITKFHSSRLDWHLLLVATEAKIKDKQPLGSDKKESYQFVE